MATGVDVPVPSKLRAIEMSWKDWQSVVRRFSFNLSLDDGWVETHAAFELR